MTWQHLSAPLYRILTTMFARMEKDSTHWHCWFLKVPHEYVEPHLEMGWEVFKGHVNGSGEALLIWRGEGEPK